MKMFMTKAVDTVFKSYLYLVMAWLVVALGSDIYMTYLDATHQDQKIKTIVSWFYSTFDGNRNSDTSHIR